MDGKWKGEGQIASPSMAIYLGQRRCTKIANAECESFTFPLYKKHIYFKRVILDNEIILSALVCMKLNCQFKRIQ